MPNTVAISPTGDAYVDSILGGVKWSVNSLTYSFPTSGSYYGPAYGSGEVNSFLAFTPTQQAAVRSILTQYSSVINFTFTETTETATNHGDLRYAESAVPSTAWAYTPSTDPIGGDAWFGSTNHWYDNPVPGSYGWLTMMHETGHTLGLKHPQTNMGNGFGVMPADHDSVEYTVMSYRSFVGAGLTGLSNETYGYPTTLMMYDVAALQDMYGANYTTNSGDTVYKWNPLTGQEYINGIGQAVPGANRIFMNVWDGGGHDTYDFSNYTTNLKVDLSPGGWTVTSTAQLANLGGGHFAVGNISNSLLFQGNTASLIDDAIGGSGNDTITGNVADNHLTGGAGNDILDGGAGNDTAVYSGQQSNYQMVHNANGTWTVTDLRAGSPDGTDTLTNIENLQFSNGVVALNNVQTLPTLQVPTIASFSADSGLVGDRITNDNTLTFTGGATAGSTVKLFDGATLLGTVTANASGGWTFTTALLADGAHNFTVSAADASGNMSATSSPFAITVDTVAPNAPTITSVSPDSNIAGDGVTNAATLTLHGSAEVGSVVQIFDGMTLLGSTSTDATGAWTFTSYDPTSAAPAFGDPDEVALDETAAGAGTGTALAEGAHTFTVKAVDAAGNVSAASAPVNMTVDTVAPAAPTIASFSTDTGAIGDGITSDNTLLLSGTAEANSVVKIYDGATLLGSATTNAGGSWSFTTAVLADGAHTFSAKATDVAGNTGAVSASLNVTVDTVAPSAPVIANFSNDSGTVGDGITNDNTLLLTGTAAVGSTIQIYDGATLLGNTVANVGGAWSFATATLADGAHAFMAKASDAAGNISTASASLNVVVDTMAPGAPVIGSFSNDTGTVGDGITSDNTLVLAGTAAAGSTVQLYDGGTLLGSTTASAGGAWNFSTAVLADGTHAFTAKATDAAGNASAASSVLNVAVDTAAPNVPVISGFSNDTGVVGDGITGANVLNLAGVATPGGTVQVYDGATLLGNASVTAGGAWAFTTPTLADGSHALSAKVTDIAGNASSASASLNVVVDTVAPNAPVVASFSNDSGVVGDGITNANMLTLAGTAAANSTIQVYDGATLLGITSTNASGAWNFATATLTDGAHAFSAKAIDAAGNISVASAALGVSIDTVAPNAPVIGSFSTDTGVVGDGVTSDNTLVLTGTAAAGSTVQVYDGATLLGNATANAGGVWNFATATLSDGAHSFSAKAGDAAGNISAASASLSVVVDTVAPSAPSISNFSTDTGTVGDGITSDNTLILTGTAAAGSSVQVYDGATLLGSATANAGGTWNFATATLNDGAHSFTAKATDVAGNTSGASTAISVTIDTVAPNAPVISSFSNDTGTVGDAITSDNTLLLTGSAAAGSSVQVYDGVTLLGSATANASGVWSFATATLADGAHAFSAKASDAAGNMSASSAVLSITVDTAAPNAPVIANFSNDTGAVGDGITGANALNLSGTAAAGSVVQIYDGVTLLGNATAGVAGAWSFATTTLADGNHAFTAKAIDAAGNTSFASAPLNVTVDTVAPTAPVIASFSNDTGTVGDGITTANDLTLNGTAAAGSAVQVFDGATLLGSATADAGGLWNFATGLLAGGAHAFTARAVDLAGNVSSASTVLAIAIIASTVPTVTSFSPDTAIAGDGVTNASSITLTGTADANNSIDIYDGARLLGTVTSNSNGNWSFVTPPLSEGTHAFTAKMSDGAGHSIGSATALTVTVDTIAPYVPVVASFSPDSGIVGDGITNSNRLVLNGGAAAGSTVQVFDGTALIGTTTANATGGWSFTTGALTDGAHAFKAIATDVAGNSSAMSSALAVTVDTVASTTPKITSFADDTGVVGDGLTNDRVLTLSGTAEANATVNVFDGVTWIASTTANANGVWSLVTPSLTEGAHAFSANSTDAAANTGAASVTLNVMVDTTAPDAPVVASFSGDTGVIGDGITSANVLTLSGTAAAGSLIQVYDGASLLGNATANSAGSWSFTTSALGDGAHAFAAKATDAAGNASPLSLTLNVTVDTVAPATPAIVSFSPDTSVIGDGITDAHVLTLTGTAESNITVKIYDGTTLLGQTKADAAGAWNFTTATLSSGNHKFTAAAADVAGNSSVTGAALSVVVDPNNIVDQAPTVSGTGLATARNQTVSATQLFTASDADGDAITSYQFYDATTNATSGHFAVNGVAQAAQTVFSVTAAQLAQTSFQAGTTGDSLMVRAFDGTTWSAWTDISPSLQNHAAVVATSAVTAGRSQTVAASSLFSANDADGDAIVSYQFYDASTSATSGNFVVNGVVQAAQTILNVSASQLAQTNFVTGSTGDSLQVRAYDGTSWSAWTDVSVAIPDHAAIVTTAAATIARNQSVAASSLFSVSDSDGDAITSYQFYDGTTASTSGHFVVNGVTQAAQTVFSVTAAQLAQTSFQAGTTGDGLMVRAYDGTAWSDWTDISASIPNHAAVMTTSAVSAARNQTVSAATLFSTNDADGDAIVSYQFYDGTTSGTSGHFAVNGVDQTAQTIFTVTPAQLAQTSFHTGTTSDSIMARAFDGTNWSDWTDVSIAIPNHAPVVTTNTAPVTAHQDVAVSSLFSASDADGDAITAYQFWDNTGDASSGHFMVNGIEQAAHTIFEVSAAQLSQTDFQTGSGVNDAYMRVFDGTTWSDWTSMNVDVTNNAPTVTASVTVASPDQSLAASSLFSVSDVEHNAITAYQFWDQTTDASSGHFVVNGVDQSAQSIIDVSAAELSQTSFKTGAGSDDLYARAFDGTSWSDWTEFNVVTSAPNAAPANTLQIVGTANNDALVSTSANEQLTGGSGSDTFVFAANFGKDVITDFQASGTSHDVIAFSQSVFNDFAAVLAHATQVGADVVIAADPANSVTIKNVAIDKLQSDHFHII